MSSKLLPPLPERLSLARTPTPIQLLERLSRRLGRNVWVWRDDLTGLLESGNKVRKLEFLVAEALRRGATRLITGGGPQSNHARATVMVARRLGLDVSVVIREPRGGFDWSCVPQGNLLLDRLAGADIEVISFADFRARGSSYAPFLEAAADKARTRGERPYVIPEGGSSGLGALGYVQAVEELKAAWQAIGHGSAEPDALFVAVGSGGTLAGLHLGYQRSGLDRRRLHGVNVCDSAAYFQKRCGTIIAEAGAAYGLACDEQPLSIFDGHFGAGYAETTPDELRFFADLLREEGLLLDPVYTGKAFRGMLAELTRGAARFGRDLLFLHTGGQLATFHYAALYAPLLASLPPPRA